MDTSSKIAVIEAQEQIREIAPAIRMHLAPELPRGTAESPSIGIRTATGPAATAVDPALAGATTIGIPTTTIPITTAGTHAPPAA